MRRIRILLAGMSPMMQQIVRQAVRSDPDLEFAGVATSSELDSTVRRTRADAVIVELPDVDAVADYESLLYDNPRLRLLAVTDGGRGTILCELRPHVVVLGELGAEGVLDALRPRPTSRPRGAS